MMILILDCLRVILEIISKVFIFRLLSLFAFSTNIVSWCNELFSTTTADHLKFYKNSNREIDWMVIFMGVISTFSYLSFTTILIGAGTPISSVHIVVRSQITTTTLTQRS